MRGVWENHKPDQKRAGHQGQGWLRSPQGYKVVRIASAGESRWAKWVEVTDADLGEGCQPQVRQHRRMLRFNAVQLWLNLRRQAWQEVPPQW